MIDEMKENVIRLKVFSEVVERDNRKPIYKYANMDLPFALSDHMKMLKIGKEQIGFIVSPYNLNDALLPLLKLKDHVVIEMKQLYHPNAQTFAVIHKDYVEQAIEWKLYKIEEVK